MRTTYFQHINIFSSGSNRTYAECQQRHKSDNHDERSEQDDGGDHAEHDQTDEEEADKRSYDKYSDQQPNEGDQVTERAITTSSILSFVLADSFGIVIFSLFPVSVVIPLTR